MIAPTSTIDTIGLQYTGRLPGEPEGARFADRSTPVAPDRRPDSSPAADQAAFLRRMAERLGADPTDPDAGTPEGLARVGAERLVSSAFLEPLVREARENAAPTGRFAPGVAEKRFGHLFDRAIADSIAGSRRFAAVATVERDLLERIQSGLGGPVPAAASSTARTSEVSA